MTLQQKKMKRKNPVYPAGGKTLFSGGRLTGKWLGYAVHTSLLYLLRTAVKQLFL